ncbi:MAG: hypothetical protein MUC50_09315 [Myxococcota bacterium]|jgi:hypothetical protein|nr:hypothetical protein [Myxococcota bacterium]
MNRLCYFAVIAQCVQLACRPAVPSAQVVCASNDDCPKGWICDRICRLSTDETPTEPHTDGTESDSGAHGSDTSSSSTSSTEPTSCQLAQQNDAHFICCPSKIPKTCAKADWFFSSAQDSAMTYGCCSADLRVLVACLSTGEWAPRTCENTCQFASTLMTCDGPKNNNCNNPIVIGILPRSWYGRWSDFANTIAPINPCGTGTEDAVFLLTLPSTGSLTVSSPDPATLRHLNSCSNPTCLDWTTSPNEKLAIRGTAGDKVVILVSQNGSDDRAFSVRFEP